MANIKVKDCNGCPFVGYYEFCGEDNNYCKADEERRKLFRNEDPESDEFENIKHPKWCPLLIEDIHVAIS